MPNQRACIPCKYPEAKEYMQRRIGEGANLKTVRSELDSVYRRKQFGYGKGPSLAMLQEHQMKHGRAMTPVSENMPTFGSGSQTPTSNDADVATAIQAEALAALERGELRVTASNALKAQEILDRRAEKAADRELTLVLARLSTMSKAPEGLIIEGEVVDLGTADD